MGVVDDAIKKAVIGLDFKKPIDRLQGACVRSRVTRQNKLNSSWNADKLAAQVAAELAVIADYIKSKDKLIAGTETVKPAHLDLLDEANAISGMGSFSQAYVEAGEKEYRANRIRWVAQIVWRAVALHPDLWESEGSPPKLAKVALDEILDRRLRAVEQMNCNVNGAHGAMLQTIQRTWDVSGPTGPWKDSFVVRNFEYPVLPKDPFVTHLPQMTDWKEEFGVVIVFTPPAGSAPVLFPKEIRPAWRVAKTTGGTLWVTYKPSSTRKAAEVIKRMFSPPRLDYHDRCWLFCDMVTSAVNVEALWFGNRRRKGDDVDFEAVANKADYLSLGPVVQFDQRHDLDTLMADDADPFFENTDTTIDELEVGDFVCYWSSRIYDMIVPGGAWRNEFSLVMGVDVDASTGKVRVLSDGPQVWLSGHGIFTVLYSGMATNIVDWIDKALTLVRAGLRVALFSDPSLTEVTTAMGHKLVLWSPYESFDSPGAWWLKIPKDIWNKEWDFATVDDVLKAVPRTVAKEAGGSGYHPPEADVVYFPLYELKVASTAADGDSWRAYLRKRKANASFRAPTALDPLKVDGRLASGLFYRGSKSKLPVVRPKVRK